MTKKSRIVLFNIAKDVGILFTCLKAFLNEYKSIPIFFGLQKNDF